MSDIDRSKTINAPLQSIWDVLADYGSLSEWADRVAHSSILNSGPDGIDVGTTRRVQVGRNALVERIVEVDPPTALAYSIEGLPRPLGHVVNRWTLQPSGETTVVTVTSRVEIGSNPLAHAVEWIVSRVMTRETDSLLTGLARRCEDTHV